MFIEGTIEQWGAFLWRWRSPWNADDELRVLEERAQSIGDAAFYQDGDPRTWLDGILAAERSW